MASLTTALQDTFQQIDSLGGIASRQHSHGHHVPAPSSRVTDTVIGNSAHDIHKLRVPSVIMEETNSQVGGFSGVGAVTAEKAAAAASARRKFYVAIFFILLLLVAVVVGIFFLRRRNKRRQEQLKKEKEEKEAAEAAARLAAIEAAKAAEEAAAAAQAATEATYEHETLRMESQVAAAQDAERRRKEEQQKRLQEMKTRLDAGISNVVSNVSTAVAQSIASQRTFQAHASTQEHDQAKVLQDTGKPNIATAPVVVSETAPPSTDVLNKPVSDHPAGDVPVNQVE